VIGSSARRAYHLVNPSPLFLPHSIAITLAFVIPRVPGFSINGSSPLTSASGWFNDSIPAEFSRFPANFSFAGAISLQVDTTSNFLPLVFNHLDAQVYDLDSFRLIGTGHLNHTKLPAKAFTDISLPLNFTYLATNDSDLTCEPTFPFSNSLLTELAVSSIGINWYNACKNNIQYTGGVRPGPFSHGFLHSVA
jgi:hypothetical protein